MNMTIPLTDYDRDFLKHCHITVEGIPDIPNPSFPVPMWTQPKVTIAKDATKDVIVGIFLGIGLSVLISLLFK